MRQTPLVLVVDDNECSLIHLAQLFRSAGVKVVTAASALEAVRVCRRKRPDLVVMDVVMPGMDGGMVAELLQETGELRGIPVILMSALEENELRDRAKEAGAVDYLPKPFRKEKLSEIIASWLVDPHAWAVSLS